MSRARTWGLTAVALIAFAGNSLLCRQALAHTGIDAASFTSIRLLAGAVTLTVIVRVRDGGLGHAGSWSSALALFAYAAGFSFAYLSLPAATGALLLFGAVQATMIGYGIWAGERLQGRRLAGLVLALGGLVGLLLPGLSAPPWRGAVLMLGAGVAWGIYSLRGAGGADPTCVTAGNFLRAVVFAVGLSSVMWPSARWDAVGIGYAIASGALASGVGYAIWYTALRGLTATTAASVQLSVPVLAALGAVAFLGETVTPRLVLAATAILGGIALVVADRRRAD